MLLLFSAACLAEKQQIHILYFLVWPEMGSNTQSTALEASMIIITPLSQLSMVLLYQIHSAFYSNFVVTRDVNI
jgi:hypothetical protein